MLICEVDFYMDCCLIAVTPLAEQVLSKVTV